MEDGFLEKGSDSGQNLDILGSGGRGGNLSYVGYEGAESRGLKVGRAVVCPVRRIHRCCREEQGRRGSFDSDTRKDIPSVPPLIG